MENISGKVIVITGASSGLGEAAAGRRLGGGAPEPRQGSARGRRGLAGTRDERPRGAHGPGPVDEAGLRRRQCDLRPDGAFARCRSGARDAGEVTTEARRARGAVP